MQKAGEALTGGGGLLSANKKISDMKHETREPTASTPLTTDYGVKQATHDEWLSASTGERQGPQLLEDNFGREKVCLCSYIYKVV